MLKSAPYPLIEYPKNELDGDGLLLLVSVFFSCFEPAVQGFSAKDFSV